jgi:GWxTD domain-containing protein
MKKILRLSLLLSLMFLIFISCSFSRKVNNLSPEHSEFLSEVRYIITKKEKRVFRNLLPSEREKFIEEFWKKRDPDPETEINQFKDTYYDRIKEANHLFAEGATPGWLQDRGRIYILLGPPEIRDVYPMGYSFYDRPSEVWYYGLFPIIFIDYSFAGNYELLPLSAQHVATLMSGQMNLKPRVAMEGVTLDFKLKLKKIAADQVQVQIEIPYKNIWLTEKDDRLETTLRLNIEVISNSKKKVWGMNEEYLISLGEDEIKESLGKKHEIPVKMTLSRGKYRMTILLENKTDNTIVKKTIKFNL